MIRTKDEIISIISQRIGEDNSDEAISLLEDITDTLNDYETKTTDSTNWKQKYEDNDRDWRERYKERFMSGSSDDIEEDIIDEPEERKYTFDELFTKG